ncbi:unnamed protein product [Knipowitschia caucasica]
MEKFFEKSGLNIKNCVTITGEINGSNELELLEQLKNYGSHKIRAVDSKNLVVEYKHESSIIELKHILPYTHVLSTNPELSFHVALSKTTLSESSTASAPPPDYMEELKRIARRSGQNLELVLQEVMLQISSHLDSVEPTGGQGEQPMKSEDPAPPLPGQQGVPLTQADLNPPQVQKMVVEHIVRAEDFATHSGPAVRLRPFSGKTPKTQNEADYDTWRSHIELLLTDVNLPPLHVTRRIIESLLSPAADVVKGLRPDTLPSVYLQVLDSAYSTVQDGEELFAQFLNTLQDAGENPSSYLQRLLLTLNTVVKRGGVVAADVDKHLLRQFCRGCWDNGIIGKLQLEQKRDNPPSFAELLLLLRTEEDRQLAKESLMKKHMGSSKQRATLQAQTTCPCSHSNADSTSIRELKEQMRALQQQMSVLLTQTSKNVNRIKEPNFQPTGGSRPQNTRPRPGFCYKCGEDGHIVTTCNQPANSTLVQQKKTQLRQNQQRWDQNQKNHLN